MAARRFQPLSSLVPVTLAVLFFGVCLCPGETNREVRNTCKLQGTQVDRKRDGPVDYKVFFQVTSTVTQAVVTVECDHRALGASDWLIRVGTTNTNGSEVGRRLVAGAILLVVDSLRHDYPRDPIGEVCLEPALMPTEFSVALYQAVAAQMRQLDSKATRFDDPKVRKMVRGAYQKMDFVRYIQGCLEKEGFTVKIDTAELCCLQRSVEGMAWKNIANEPAVGLNVESATCCLDLERANARR